MRDIRFRAWDKARKVMHPPSTFREVCEGRLDKKRKFEEFEFLEWTGLQDKNGKEIYEWDILSSRGYRLVVKFDKGIFYAETYGGYRLSLEEILCWWEASYIGNIYENPELLKGA